MERELIAALKTHDQKALKAIFEQHHAALCTVAFHMVGDKELAKDIVQDVFIKLWKNRQQLDITTSLKAYLKKATVNTALNAMAKTSFAKKADLSDAVFNKSTNTTEQETAFAELQTTAEKAINGLPLRTRTVFRLIRNEDMSYKEVANTLDISEKAVEKEMMKALKLLRDALKDFLPAMIFIVTNIFS